MMSASSLHIALARTVHLHYFPFSILPSCVCLPLLLAQDLSTETLSDTQQATWLQSRKLASWEST